jgi:DNA-binding Lrp family transcriptional regulator
VPAPLNAAAARLDETDRKVLEVLSRDGRASYAEIGLLVNLSATAVKRRVDRLRERGVVRGFTVVLDPASLEWRTEAFVEV